MLAEHPVRELHAYLDYALALRCDVLCGVQDQFCLLTIKAMGKCVYL